MTEFIKFGIREPQVAAETARSFFGSKYKSLIAEGFAHAINLGRLTDSELVAANPFLQSVYNTKVDFNNTTGEIIKDALGVEQVDVLRGLGKEVQDLIDLQKAVTTQIGLNRSQSIEATEKLIKVGQQEEINMANVVGLLGEGEVRVVPFFKDFAKRGEGSGDPTKVMNDVAEAIIRNNSDLSMGDIKAGLLTAFKETLMSDLIVGSGVGMKPAEKIMPEDLIGRKAERDQGDAPIIEAPQTFKEKLNPFNKVGTLSQTDESIIKQLRNKEVEWVDVLKQWNKPLNSALTEYRSVIDFITTGPGAITSLADEVTLLSDLEKTQRNIINEDLNLSVEQIRTPLNIPRKWTAAQASGFLNTYMKRITSRFYAISYITYQMMKVRNAQFQARMFTDPNARTTMEQALSGNTSKLNETQKNLARDMIVSYLPTVEELYPEENNQETLAKYEQIRKEAIIDILSEYGLVKKEQRIKALSEPELIEKGKEFPGDIQLRNQLKELNLDR